MQPASDHPQPRRRSRALLVCVAIAMTLIADVGGTALLRAFGLYTPPARAEAAFRRWDPVYHHGLRPNTRSTDGGRWGQIAYPVCTNSLGFKDSAPRVVTKEPVGRRVLLIGDSFTEGVGCAFEDTFAGILARELGKQHIEVLNAACVTYSPVIYRRKVQHLLEVEGLRFDHLVVCLDMSDIVDEIKYYRLDERGDVEKRVETFSQRWKQLVAEHTILMRAIREGLHVLREGNRDGDRSVVDHERSSWTRDPGLWSKYGEPGLRSAATHLDALRELLATRGIAMTLVVYPWPDQILNDERECAQVTFWRVWTAKRGVQFVNCFPTFLDAGPAADVIERCFIAKDMHWNAAGHALMAETLLRALRP